jgi:hypothetical protein
VLHQLLRQSFFQSLHSLALVSQIIVFGVFAIETIRTFLMQPDTTAPLQQQPSTMDARGVQLVRQRDR